MTRTSAIRTRIKGLDALSRRFCCSESGQGLLELVIAMSFISIAVGALLSMMAAGAASLQRSERSGTALTLADRQLELYRTISYGNIRLSNGRVAAISSTDPYMTANATDPTIPAGTASGQVTDVAPNPPCPNPVPPECQPEQTVVGPDHRSYRVDTYITYLTATDANGVPIGRQNKQVTVVVRDVTGGTLNVLARNTSTFDQSNLASG